ncbi:hypothetical protein THASP1DRAFT_33766 [Thamnocephalis sphaerospora]|uniref:VWFA domain-containing protein n=1 Tax=Thamnocephalis sphaerospora TaxID=78915 RepID=A0A4P9XFU9_9FUNG|nr:hypothetical protein THASP1DRAFT_33766 [Thamnocephalis sphaerospora]|eukprot:RKP04464.1 hypothetical protein THASP1DRAFT_33766 [Thamnocephalis sphaerospora]
MIIVFLVDTSTYAARCFADGTTLLDATRTAARSLAQRIRQTSPSTRFMLVSYAPGIKATKCSLADSPDELAYALERLRPDDAWNGGNALGTVFDALQLDRSLRQTDTFGKGRLPGIFDPVKVLWFSYGGHRGQDEQRLEIPGSTCPGAELYREPFRWDQRINALLMLPEGETPAAEQIGMMANVTGGK